MGYYQPRFVKRRFDTKVRKAQALERQKVVDVSEWWAGRINTRKIFQNGGFEAGDDYLGELPWPRFVSLKALHEDYIRSGYTALTRLEFGYRWRQISGVQRADKHKPLRTSHFVMRSMYDISRFQPHLHIVQEWEDDRANQVLYGETHG